MTLGHSVFYGFTLLMISFKDRLLLKYRLWWSNIFPTVLMDALISFQGHGGRLHSTGPPLITVIWSKDAIF